MRVLLVGLLAFVLVTQAAAAAMKAPSAPAPRTAKTAHKALTLDQQLERKVAALQRYRGAIRFFETHRSLLSSSEHRTSATSSLAYAKQRVRQLTKTVAALRGKGAQARRAPAGGHAAEGRDLRRIRRLLPGGGCRGVVRVSLAGDRAKRSVSRALPDGLVRTAAVRARLVGPRAGSGGSSLLRALRSRLEPVELPLGCELIARIDANCGRVLRARVALETSFW